MNEITEYIATITLSAALGAAIVWNAAHDSADETLEAWKRSVQEQNDAEVKRVAEINRRIIDGMDRDRAELRRRLAAGWKPTIPAAPSVSACEIPKPASGTDEATPAGIPDAEGDADLLGELGVCLSERERLIADGQETVLQCNGLKKWIKGVVENGKE
jgi:hypothetical protein